MVLNSSCLLLFFRFYTADLSKKKDKKAKVKRKLKQKLQQKQERQAQVKSDQTDTVKREEPAHATQSLPQ